MPCKTQGFVCFAGDTIKMIFKSWEVTSSTSWPFMYCSKEIKKRMFEIHRRLNFLTLNSFCELSAHLDGKLTSP